jgi:hypothetical protein
MFKDRLVEVRQFWFRTKRISSQVIIGLSMLTASGLTLSTIPVVQANTRAISVRSIQSADQLIQEPCEMSSTVIAGYQVWHGLANHLQPPPYVSTDTAVIARHIQQAKAACIDVIAPDWYGPPDGLWNDKDREFIDRGTDELIHQAEANDLKVALMYDQGTLNDPSGPLSTTRVISDLLYATKYFTSQAYLQIDGHPALFIFPYENVEKTINWAEVRQQLGVTVTLLDKDLDLSDSNYDNQFDGFYPWVRPDDGQWFPDGSNWGRKYLKEFYTNMTTGKYANKITIGGVWPGFDDRLASWGERRTISRRCGQTWSDTLQIAKQYNPPYILISTWNDFEEGSDIENGIIKLMATNDSPTILDQTTTLTATMSDCNDTVYFWKFGDGTTGSGAQVSHIYPTSGIYPAVVLGTNPTATLTITNTVIVSPTPWCEDFDPLYPPRWVEHSAKWEDIPGPSALLKESDPTEFYGKVESEIITVDVDKYPFLRVDVANIDDVRYTIQILDKSTDTSKNVLENREDSGEHFVNLVDKMGWHGEQSFTINVWVIGESKSVTFNLICIEEPYKVFLPVVMQQ